MTTEQPIRILIADDHPVVRRGLQALIHLTTDMELVGEAADGLEAVSKARSLQPDVIVLDLLMPRLDGLGAIQAILTENPAARILVVTSFAENDKVIPAIKAGALGYLLKDADPDLLLRAIRDVHRGESSLHPTIARKLIHELNQPRPETGNALGVEEPYRGAHLPTTSAPLTRREREVQRLVAQGLANQEIANQLSLSEGTVRIHVSNILGKLHLDNRTQALYAQQTGLAE